MWRSWAGLTAGESWWVVVDIGKQHCDGGGTRQTPHLTHHVLGLDHQQVTIPCLSVHVCQCRPHHTCRWRQRHSCKSHNFEPLLVGQLSCALRTKWLSLNLILFFMGQFNSSTATSHSVCHTDICGARSLYISGRKSPAGCPLTSSPSFW